MPGTWVRACGVGAAGVLAAVGAIPVQAAQTTASTVPCSVPALVMAIHTANSTPGAQTLDLARGCTYTLVAPDNAANGLPVVTSDITINGRRATITRHPSASNFRILTVASAGTLTLNTVTISGGKVATTISGENAMTGCANSVIGGVCGGGIHNLGALTLNNSRVINNTATADVVLSGFVAEGGGIANHGKATLNNTKISGNTASYTGPIPSPTGIANSVGIANDNALTPTTTAAAMISNIVVDGGGITNRGSLTIDTSRVSHNIVSVAAGTYGIAERAAVANFASATIKNSIISDNASTAPKGIARAALGNDMQVATMTVTDTEISRNTSSAPGGFVPGAAVAVSPGSMLTMTRVVVSDNTASAPGGTVQGGSITNYNGTLHLTDSEVTYNTATGKTAHGGGFFNASSGTSTLTRTAVTANTARGTTIATGGGIFNANTADGSVTLIDSNVSGNNPNDCTPSIGTCT